MGGSERREEVRNAFEHTRAQFESTNERITKRAGRNLVVAVASGLLFGGLFILSLFIFKPLFAIFVAVLLVIAVVELAVAFRGAGRRVPRAGVAIGSLLIVAGAYFYGPVGALLSLFASTILVTLWRLVEGLVPRWEVPRRTLIRDVFSGVFVLTYVSFLGSFAVLLLGVEQGQWWVFALVAVTVATDIGAYAAGITLGKHKMTPNISPNKTWEGFAGAALAAVIVAVIVSTFGIGESWWVGILLGIVVLLTATGGDLTESLIKRNLGVKDMSTWIPGHGGFLDRLDSLLPSAVGVYGVALSAGAI